MKHDLDARQKIVITTDINDRKQYIERLTTSNDGGFIPHYTTDPEKAKDFLSTGQASEYIDAIKPAGMQSFNIESVLQNQSSL